MDKTSYVKILSDKDLIDLITQRLDSRQKNIKELQKTYRDLEELNTKLSISENNKSKFLSLIRNEFNNPLFGIIPLLEDLYVNEADSNKKDLLDIIFKQIQKMNYQLNNVMVAAEIETDMLQLNISYFSLNSMINDINITMAHVYNAKNITFNLDYNLEDEICSDKDKIFTIITNLIANGYEHSQSGRYINVHVKSDDKYIYVDIANEGNEIENVENIFDSFYQKSGNYNRLSEGLGIGLSIVKNYIDFLSGKIELNRKNNENIFSISIPIFKSSCEDMFLSNYDDGDFSFDDSDMKTIKF
jgi:signal transduction histidine kinase